MLARKFIIASFFNIQRHSSGQCAMGRMFECAGERKIRDSQVELSACCFAGNVKVLRHCRAEETVGGALWDG